MMSEKRFYYGIFVDGTEYSEKINNITPTGYVGNKISLAVNKKTKAECLKGVL